MVLRTVTSAPTETRCLCPLATEVTLRRMRKLGVALVVLFAAFDLGCSGSSSTGSAQAACQDLIANSYCPKIVACFAGGDAGAVDASNAGQIDQATCLSMASGPMGLDCTKVTGENADPKTCMDDINKITTTECPIFVMGDTIVLPASCHGLFRLNP